MSVYPPQPSQFSDFTKMLEVLKSTVPLHTALYVSAPITSGRRLTDWYIRSNGNLPSRSHPTYSEQHAKEVIQPNLDHAAAVIGTLRQKYTKHSLIDPTAMGDIERWTQDDYRFFWGEVIRRYVAQVVFVDGWQFSSGCAYEFLIAQQESIVTLDEEGAVLTVEGGASLLSEAVGTIGVHTESGEFIRGVLGDLSKVPVSKDSIYA